MPIRRIVVAIDASPASVTALEAAGELAVILEAEVLGLFVEDVNVLRWGTLPFAHEVGAVSATRRRTTSADVERQLRLQAERARGALAAVEARSGVRTSFRIARGTVTEELLRILTAEDLLSLGVTGYGQSRLLGSTAVAVASAARGRVLLMPHGARLAVPVAVLFDGSPSGVEAIDTALAFAGGRQPHVLVYCVAESQETAEQLARQAANHLGRRGEQIHYRHLKPKDLLRAADVARSIGAAMLVLPGPGDVITWEVIERVVTAFAGPALVVRVIE